MVDIQDGEFVRVRIASRLERSLQMALSRVHAPFFTFHEEDALVVILRREEWEHLAPHFLSGKPRGGFRLVSIHPPCDDDQFPARLSAALSAAGVAARLLPSFYKDNFLILDAELDRALGVIRRLVEDRCPDEAVP